jgi:hypothetical protein
MREVGGEGDEGILYMRLMDYYLDQDKILLLETNIYYAICYILLSHHNSKCPSRCIIPYVPRDGFSTLDIL